MAPKKLRPAHVLIGWKIDTGPQLGMVTISLRHQSLQDFRDGKPRPDPLVLILADDQLREFLADLSGKTAAAPRPSKLDS